MGDPSSKPGPESGSASSSPGGQAAALSAVSFSAALATGLTGAALHTAVGLGAAPRALGSFGALLGPVGVALVALTLLALVLGGLVTLCAGRCGCSPGGARAALGVTLVVAAALWPLSMDGGVTSGALVLWAVTALAAGAAAFGRAGLGAAGSGTRALLLIGAPLAALLLLAASWARTYSSTGLAAALALVALGALVLAWRGFRRVPALPVLFALAGAVLASGVGGLLRGDGDLRNHRARQFDDARPTPVVLVTIDTLRPDFLSRAREDGAVTPTLDALLADSVVFDQARASAPWTKPSVASILTGTSPLVHGTTNRRVRLPEELHTLAEHLRDAGYTTAGMGLNVHLEPFFGFAQGFDQYWFPVRDDWGDSLGAELLERFDDKRFPGLFPTTEALADVAVAWIEANEDRDFFLWIHFLDPHWPYEPPPAHLPPREEGQRIGASWGQHETVTEVQAGIHKLGAPDRDRVRALYRGEIEYVDAQLGRVLDALRAKGLYDEALIAFTSDHGEEFWEHGTFEHGHTLYDEVLRVPLAFKLPAAAAATPRRLDLPVANESLLPTVLELTGVDAQHPLTSPSLVPAWDEQIPWSPSDHLAAGTYYYDEQRMLLSDGMKLILDHGTGRAELYDLAQDPDELASFGVQDPRVRALAEKLQAREEELEALRVQLGIRNVSVQADAAMQGRMSDLGYGGDGPAPADGAEGQD